MILLIESLNNSVRRLVAGAAAFCVFFAAGEACVAAAPGDDDVAAEIARLRDSLLRAQAADGSFPYSSKQYLTGHTALVVLALAQADVAPDSAAMAGGLTYLVQHSDKMVYSEALVACALDAVDPVTFRPRITQAAAFLQDAQQADGSWSYTGGTAAGDNSNTQFAILGLAAAEHAGIGMRDAVRRAATAYWLGTGNSDGGWGYRTKTGSTIPMTCAGVASLQLLGRAFETPENECGKYRYDPAMTGALRWLVKTLPDGALQSPYYSLYALERAAVSLGMQTIGTVDWYKNGCAYLLEHPAHDSASRAFALLFLAKAAKPVAIVKWRWAGDWNNDHKDVQNWVEAASRTLGAEYDWMTSDLRSPAANIAKASLLFVNGHKEFKLSRNEEHVLRAFLADGGTVVGEACCGAPGFAAGFKAEMMRKIYPGEDASFEVVPRSHPVFTAHYDLSGSSHVVLQLRKKSCGNPRLFLLPEDISCALNGERSSSAAESAEKLAVNFLAYALQGRKPRGKLDADALDSAAAAKIRITADQLRLKQGIAAEWLRHPLGRLKHRGDWNTDPSFFDVLERELRRLPGTPRFDAEVWVDPGSDDLFAVPAVFMLGHDAPALTELEIMSVRRYLQNGGFLLAGSCCSKEPFDTGFRTLMAKMFPNDALRRIPADDPIGAALAEAGAPAGTVAYHHRFGDAWGELWGIRRDGRWMVVFSPVDFCCALEGDLEDNVCGYRLKSAVRLVAASLTYALSPPAALPANPAP